MDSLFLQQRSEMLQTLINRGDKYSVSDTIVARSRMPYARTIPMNDNQQLLQLEQLKGLTYMFDQRQIMAEQEKERLSDDNFFAPLNFRNCQFRVPQDLDINLSMLQPPEFHYDKAQAQQERLPKWSDAKPYMDAETRMLMNREKKHLVYSRILADAVEKDKRQPFYSCRGVKADCIKFESRFQSGNLFSVSKLLGQEMYELQLDPDYNTANHTGWFFFAVQGIKKGVRYTFKIDNIIKQFEEPFQPLIFDGASWSRRGENVCSYHNVVTRKNINYYHSVQIDDQFVNGEIIKSTHEYQTSVIQFKSFLKKQGTYSRKQIEKQLFTFTAPGNYTTYAFQLVFDQDVDVIYIAQNQPYFYHQIFHYLETVQRRSIGKLSQVKTDFLQFARSYFGNQVPLLRMTQDLEGSKDIVLIMGRMASSDTASTQVIEGMIEQLMGFNDRFILRDLEQAVAENDMNLVQILKQKLQNEKDQRSLLLNRYVFYFVPFINPDGAMLGGSRANYFGLCENRRFAADGSYKVPFVVMFKQFLELLHLKQRKIFWSYTVNSQQAATEFNLDAVELNSYKLLYREIWRQMGNVGIIPKTIPEMHRRFITDLSQQAFVTDTKMIQEDSNYYLDKRERQQKFDEFQEQVKNFIEQHEGYFQEFAILRHLEEYDNFSSQYSTVTSSNDHRSGTPRFLLFEQFRSQFTYNVAVPMHGNQHFYFNQIEYYSAGADLIHLMQWRFSGQEKECNELTALMQEEFFKWARTAVISSVNCGKMLMLDQLKFSAGIVEALPEKLARCYDCIGSDKLRYGEVEDLTKLFNVRTCLEINPDLDNYSDSDNSVDDNELKVQLIGTKQSSTDKKAMRNSIALWRPAFEESFPYLRKLEKRKKKKVSK